MRERLLLVAGLIVSMMACGGGPKVPTITIGPPPEPLTRATLVGPLCQAEICSCRDPRAADDGGVGAPDAGVKRFEFRLGPSEHALWVTVDDMVLYKSEARAEDCFYVDLGAGDHAVTLRASRLGGISAALSVSEYAPATQSWYASYRFECGVPGACAHDELDSYKASLARYPRGIQDPCGSVRVKGLTWDTGVAPDQLHPNDLALGLVLDLYDFAPKKPHGDPSCATRFE